MIRFDNGPPDGDYVRYIDALMAQRAASLVAATMTSDTDSVDRMRAADGRKSPMSATLASPALTSSALTSSALTSSALTSSALTSSAFKAPHERSRDAKTGVGLSTMPHASTASSPSSGASTLSPAATAAISSAIMSRDEPGTLPSVGTVVGALGIAAGVILIVIGFLGPTSNVVLMVAGAALVSWAIKRFRARSVSPAATTAADVFTAMPTQRASSRAKVKDRP